MEDLKKLLKENGYKFRQLIIGEETFLIVSDKFVDYFSQNICIEEKELNLDNN